ncbi:NUDIX domain-containing protein [Porphyromonas endodontalis]|uniref:NUDIX domain-containing protein n=1 Tax=Porphyromonas endodontalis TaxID=28124 RepID=UPI002889506F|nr:NUDIX domain-containing protein [Porphyromonas endodontalis]
MKTIEVVAAVLWHNESYLATQRGYGEFEGQCEFPGGKIEPGESLERHLNVRYKKS